MTEKEIGELELIRNRNRTRALFGMDKGFDYYREFGKGLPYYKPPEEYEYPDVQKYMNDNLNLETEKPEFTTPEITQSAEKDITSSGEGGGATAIGKGIEKVTDEVVGYIDSVGQFKRDLVKGGLSILSNIIPNTPRKLRSERMAVGRDTYGRTQYNNMFKDGGVIDRAKSYMDKNYDKIKDNPKRQEFLTQLINFKNKENNE